jgi:divalent metal cation (Fe/Co/Zn/Cd) transporter
MLICAGAVAVGGVAIAEATLRDQVAELQPIAITVESASVALAGITAVKFRARKSQFKGQVHAERHNLVDLATSSVALAGVSASSLYPYADNAAALVVGAVSFTFGTMLYKDKVS